MTETNIYQNERRLVIFPNHPFYGVDETAKTPTFGQGILICLDKSGLEAEFKSPKFIWDTIP